MMKNSRKYVLSLCLGMAFLVLILGCNNDDSFIGIVKIDMQIENFENLYFESEQCGFDDRSTTWSYNFGELDLSGTPIGHGYISTQKILTNDTSLDVSLQNWLSVGFEDGQKQHDIELLEKRVPEFSDFYYDSGSELYTQIKVGERGFTNAYLDQTGGVTSNDYFKIDLKDYKFDYTDDCDNRRMMYMHFEVEGPLYYVKNGIKMDSLILNRSQLKLIFDIE